MEIHIRALIEDLKSTDPELVSIADDTFLEIGPDGIPPLIDCLHNHMNYFRRNVEKVLVRFGEPALEMLVKEVYKNMGMEFGNDSGKFVVAMALFGETALVPLFEIVKHDISAGRIGTPVQIESTYVFKQIGELAQNYLLMQLNSQNSNNRSTATLGLCLFRSELVIDALINALEDSNETVRWFVKWSLCDSEFLPKLEETQNKTDSPELKENINDIIKEIEKSRKQVFNKYKEDER